MSFKESKPITDENVSCIKCYGKSELFHRKDGDKEAIYCKRCGTWFPFKLTKHTYDWVFKQMIPNLDNNWKLNGRWK